MLGPAGRWVRLGYHKPHLKQKKEGSLSATGGLSMGVAARDSFPSCVGGQGQDHFSVSPGEENKLMIA